MEFFDYPKDKTTAFPPLNDLVNKYHSISSGCYVKLSDMYDEHLLQSVTVFADNRKFLDEMVIRLFKERMKTSPLAQVIS